MSHDYPAPGAGVSSYTATFTVTGLVPSCGRHRHLRGQCSRLRRRRPTVSNVTATVGACTPAKTRPVVLDADVTGGQAEYDWDFGDGSSIETINATITPDPATSHDYAAPGSYTATITIKGPAGCPDQSASKAFHCRFLRRRQRRRRRAMRLAGARRGWPDRARNRRDDLHARADGLPDAGRRHRSGLGLGHRRRPLDRDGCRHPAMRVLLCGIGCPVPNGMRLGGDRVGGGARRFHRRAVSRGLLRRPVVAAGRLAWPAGFIAGFQLLAGAVPSEGVPGPRPSAHRPGLDRCSRSCLHRRGTAYSGVWPRLGFDRRRDDHRGARGRGTGLPRAESVEQVGICACRHCAKLSCK